MRRIVEGFHVNDENVQKSFHEALLHASYHKKPRKTSLLIVLFAPKKHPRFGQKAQNYRSVPPLESFYFLDTTENLFNEEFWMQKTFLW